MCNDRQRQAVLITTLQCRRRSIWHQYIDIVLEGGGTLDVTLLGYLYVLEQVGIRFIGIGGASAGSIIALLLAAIDSLDEAKVERLTELLANVRRFSTLQAPIGTRGWPTMRSSNTWPKSRFFAT